MSRYPGATLVVVRNFRKPGNSRRVGGAPSGCHGAEADQWRGQDDDFGKRGLHRQQCLPTGGCWAFDSPGTAENSNATYPELPAAPSQSFVQYFSV